VSKFKTQTEENKTEHKVRFGKKRKKNQIKQEETQAMKGAIEITGVIKETKCSGIFV